MELGKQHNTAKRLEHGTIYYELVFGLYDDVFYIKNNNLIHNLSAGIGEELLVFKELKI